VQRDSRGRQGRLNGHGQRSRIAAEIRTRARELHSSGVVSQTAENSDPHRKSRISQLRGAVHSVYRDLSPMQSEIGSKIAGVVGIWRIARLAGLMKSDLRGSARNAKVRYVRVALAPSLGALLSVLEIPHSAVIPSAPCPVLAVQPHLV
jgi:hypothetical protein